MKDYSNNKLMFDFATSILVTHSLLSAPNTEFSLEYCDACRSLEANKKDSNRNDFFLLLPNVGPMLPCRSSVPDDPHIRQYHFDPDELAMCHRSSLSPPLSPVAKTVKDPVPPSPRKGVADDAEERIIAAICVQRLPDHILKRVPSIPMIAPQKIKSTGLKRVRSFAA